MFHVYVEGVTGTAPDAVRALSDAMAERYGLPAGELYARLAKGRFRVKANVDLATADTYARDLEAIGARVRVEPAAPGSSSAPITAAVRTSPAIVQRSISATPAGVQPPAVRPAQPPLSVLQTPPAEPTQTSSSSGSQLQSAVAPEARDRLQSTQSALPPEPRDRPQLMPTLSMLPPQPSRPTLSSLPPPPSDRTPSPASALPPAQPRSRPQLSSLPPQPELRPALSVLPPQPEARPAHSTLPPQPVARPTRPSLPPQPASRPTTGPLPAHLASRATRRSLPPEIASRPTTGPLPAHLASRPASSSLPPVVAARPTRPALPSTSADWVRDDDVRASDDLGSLGALDGSGLLSLSALDGGSPEPAGVAPSAFEPPPVSSGSGLARAVAQPARSMAEPVDPFAPPGGEAAEATVELADDELAHRARKRLSTPPAVAEAAPAELVGAGRPTASDPSARRSRPPSSEPPVRWSLPPTASAAPRPAAPVAPHADPAPATWSSAQLARLAVPRVRLAAGVLLAVLLGFVPAAIVASIREDHAFRAIDAKVTAIQTAVDSDDSYDALDAFRAEQLRDKRSARQRIALASMLIWAAAGGGLAYAWFKRVPWDRLT